MKPFTKASITASQVKSLHVNENPDLVLSKKSSKGHNKMIVSPTMNTNFNPSGSISCTNNKLKKHTSFKNHITARKSSEGCLSKTENYLRLLKNKSDNSPIPENGKINDLRFSFDEEKMNKSSALRLSTPSQEPSPLNDMKKTFCFQKANKVDIIIIPEKSEDKSQMPSKQINDLYNKDDCISSKRRRSENKENLSKKTPTKNELFINMIKIDSDSSCDEALNEKDKNKVSPELNKTATDIMFEQITKKRTESLERFVNLNVPSEKNQSNNSIEISNFKNNALSLSPVKQRQSKFEEGDTQIFPALKKQKKMRKSQPFNDKRLKGDNDTPQ